MRTKDKYLLIVLLSCILTGTIGGPIMNNDGDIDENNANVTGTKEECMVQQSLSLSTPGSVKLLTYIRPSSSLKLTAKFKDKDEDYFRDDIVFSNNEAVQHMVRGDQTTPTRHQANLAIPDGWNYFDFSTEENSLEILYQGISIVRLTFEFPVHFILVKGTICNCSAGHPSWNVDEGKTIEVALQPDIIRHKVQELQIRGPLQARPFISIHNVKIPINTAVTLFVNITMHLSQTFIAVSQELQLITNITQPVSSLLMLTLGSDKDKVTIVSTLPENIDNISVENKENSSVVQPGDYTMIIGMMIGFVFGAGACITAVVAYVIWSRSWRSNKLTSDGEYSNVPFLPEETLPNRRMTQNTASARERIKKNPECRCGCCPEKVIHGNSKCCRDIEKFNKAIINTSYQCITEHEGFQTWCTDKDALRASYFYTKNTIHEHGSPKHFRSAAYNQLNTWFLNEANTYDVSDCVRSVIRNVYPEKDDKNYEGFNKTD